MIFNFDIDDENVLLFAYQAVLKNHLNFCRFRKGVQISLISTFPTQVSLIYIVLIKLKLCTYKSEVNF